MTALGKSGHLGRVGGGFRPEADTVIKCTTATQISQAKVRRWSTLPSGSNYQQLAMRRREPRSPQGEDRPMAKRTD